MTLKQAVTRYFKNIGLFSFIIANRSEYLTNVGTIKNCSASKFYEYVNDIMIKTGYSHIWFYSAYRVSFETFVNAEMINAALINLKVDDVITVKTIEGKYEYDYRVRCRNGDYILTTDGQWFTPDRIVKINGKRTNVDKSWELILNGHKSIFDIHY